MEKMCEFCAATRPAIYCKADSAYLCLACDARVHSANTLSSRHHRAVLCEACGLRPSGARCSEHRLFLCRACDRSLHNTSSAHQRRAVRSFVGCPSARDFAALWGYKTGELETAASRSVGQSKDRNSSVVQQIIELKRFQQGTTNLSPLIHCQEQDGAKRLDQEYLNQNPTDSALEIYRSSSRLKGLKCDDDPFPLLYSQLESSPSNAEPLCQNRSNQLWSQNMEDLGVCEELVCEDDFNIPDVDLTFRNFEELFGGDDHQDSIRSLLNDDQDMIFSFDDHKDRSLHKLIEDTSMASCIFSDMDRDMSMSLSRFSADSVADSLDTGVSPLFEAGSTPELESEASRENAKLRYKEKKKSRLHETNIQYPSRKARTDVRKRVKGRFVKAQGYDSDTADVARSY